LVQEGDPRCSFVVFQKLPKYITFLPSIPLPKPEARKDWYNATRGPHFLPKIQSYESLAAAACSPGHTPAHESTAAESSRADDAAKQVPPSPVYEASVEPRPGTSASAANSWDVSSDEESPVKDPKISRREEARKAKSFVIGDVLKSPALTQQATSSVLGDVSKFPAPVQGPKTPPLPTAKEDAGVVLGFADAPLSAEVKPSLLSSRIDDREMLEAGTNPPPPGPVVVPAALPEKEKSPTPPPPPSISSVVMKKEELFPLSSRFAADMSDVSDDEACLSEHEDGEIVPEPGSSGEQRAKTEETRFVTIQS
jgi:hypothetical protein